MSYQPDDFQHGIDLLVESSGEGNMEACSGILKVMVSDVAPIAGDAERECQQCDGAKSMLCHENVFPHSVVREHSGQA